MPQAQDPHTETTPDAPDEPQGKLTVRTLAMPGDTNPYGDIFGGWVLSQMDIAGGIAAIEAARGRIATVAIEAMTFISPVKIGDILCVYTAIERLGNTSITVGIEVWIRRGHYGDRIKVTNGRYVYVALDADGNKRPVRNGE